MKLNKKLLVLLSFSFLFFLASSFLLPSFSLAQESLYYIHQDHLSSTNLVTNQDGEIVSNQNYYPYGSTRLTTGGSTRNNIGDTITERQYTSQVSDQDQTGLYYYNARYYDPRVAIFTQADSLGDGLNHYAYVNNNPLLFVDPGGNEALSYSNWVEQNWKTMDYPQEYDCANLPVWYMVKYAEYAGITEIDWSQEGYFSNGGNLDLKLSNFLAEGRGYNDFARAAMAYYGGSSLEFMAGQLGGGALSGTASEVASSKDGGLRPGDFIVGGSHSMVYAEPYTVDSFEANYYRLEILAKKIEASKQLLNNQTQGGFSVLDYQQGYQGIMNLEKQLVDLKALATAYNTQGQWNGVAERAIQKGALPFYFQFRLIDSPGENIFQGGGFTGINYPDMSPGSLPKIAGERQLWDWLAPYTGEDWQSSISVVRPFGN